MKRRDRTSSAPTRAGVLCGLWLLGLGVLLGACRDPAKVSGTALYVTIEFPPTMLMDQIRVSGTVEDSAIGPHLLPEEAMKLLANGDTFRVLLPSVSDGAQAQLRVEGLAGGSAVALGTTQAQVREGYEVDVTVRLEPWAPDGGPPDGGTPDGGTPDGGALCPDCETGCCLAGVCTTSARNTCGTGGRACVVCDSSLANACSAEGTCSCDQGPACDPMRAERCTGNGCRCGNNDQCDPGQQCVEGQCRCNPTSCSGCCVNNVCAPGTWRSLCGAGGETCRSCGRNESCTNGDCD